MIEKWRENSLSKIFVVAFFPFLLWCNIFISNDSLYSANYGLELVLRVHFYRGCNIIILQCVLTISFKTFSTSWIMHIQMHTYTPIVQLKLINATSVDFNQFYWIHARLSTCSSPKVKFYSIVNALFCWICYCNWAKVDMITAHISPMHTTSVVQYEMFPFFPAIFTLKLKKCDDDSRKNFFLPIICWKFAHTEHQKQIISVHYQLIANAILIWKNGIKTIIQTAVANSIRTKIDI